MARAQIVIPRSVVQKYLEEKEGARVSILSYEKLGSGWHGTGYKIKFKVLTPPRPDFIGTRHPSPRSREGNKRGEVKEVVLRTLMPADFSHDYAADRAKVFLLQHEMSGDIPGHVESLDVSGFTGKGKLVSLGDVREFFQVVEVAHGAPYSADFQRIKETGRINEQDRRRAKELSDYLVSLHSRKFNGSAEELRSIRRRHSRDAVGHGEMMMGVIDTYPDNYSFIDKKEMTDIICKAVRFRERTKDIPFTPRRMHGDFHPANVLFEKDEFTVLDASREIFGDPADDVTTMAINYIWFAVMQAGGFSGPFAELFGIYWDNYFKKAGETHILRTAGTYFAFRGVVVAHPVFYKEQSDDVRRKMMSFVSNILSEESFDPDKIDQYLR